MSHKKPIILIPGIQGTRLSSINNVDFKTAWSGVKKYFSNVHELKLNRDGISDIGAENIIERADVEDMAYADMVHYLRSVGYRVFIFGYDWRKSNIESAYELDEFIVKIKRKLNENKINFITHSMGGVVLSAYLKLNSQNIDNVNKAIFTVPPFLGSVEATYNLVIGKSLLFNSSDDFRKIARTFPGIYELLPVYDGAYKNAPEQIDYYDFDSYWQQYKVPSNNKIKEYEKIRHRMSELKKVRDENNLVFDLSRLSKEERNKLIVLVGGGEKTKTDITIETDRNDFKYFFNFGDENDVTENGGDGTVPIASSSIFKNDILTLQIDASWLEKRAASGMLMSDWHAFFLNNSKPQNIAKRFFDPKFVDNTNWFQSIDKDIKILS